jgi:predicted lipid carrier protein YhbT
MVPYLSQAWLDRQRALTGALPERPGVTARVQYVVTGAPAGEVHYAQTVVDGRVTAATLGDDADAEVTLSQVYAVAVDIARGELDPNAAFMQGRVKVVGDMGRVMALMPLTHSDEYRAAQVELAAQTEF